MIKKRNLNKEKIIKAAFSLADEIGVENINFQKLADKLGIKYPSLYNHFANVNALKIEMTIYLFKILNFTLMENLLGKSGEDAIREYAKTYREFALNNKTAYFLFINVLSYENKELQISFGETINILSKILKIYIEDENERIHKSRHLRSLLHGFVSLKSLGYFTHKADLNRTFELMINDFISSVQK